VKRRIIGLGADSPGFPLKDAIRKHLADRYDIVDFGVASVTDRTMYPEIGIAVAEAVADGRVDRAILVCGTGIGMAISANKVPGVRAAVATDQYSVERSVLSNNCQVLALGSRVVAAELAFHICDQWLSLAFDPRSHSANNLAVLARYEARHRQPEGGNRPGRGVATHGATAGDPT
jgi:ribose 5-phosphate isomerase B